MINTMVSFYENATFGQVKLVTNNESRDIYTERVRSSWVPDPEVFLAIELLKNSDGQVLDLGANIGTWCLPVCLGSKKKVVAFEALPDNVTLLKDAINKNMLSGDVKVIDCAIWDCDTDLNFSGTSAYGTVNPNGKLKVVARSLDSLYEEGHINNPSLIKIDIEGCELRAIEGGRRFLKSLPDIIFEGNGAHGVAQGYFPQDIVALLEDMGYHLYMIFKDLLIPVNRKTFQPFGLINYLATRKSLRSLKSFKLGHLKPETVEERVTIALTKMNPGYARFMKLQLEKGTFEISESVSRIIEMLSISSA